MEQGASGFPFGDDALPDHAVKGRGAIGNRPGRFETLRHVALDDGWGGWDGGAPESEEPPHTPPVVTTLTADTSRTVIARNDSPDVPFDRSVNPYRGCEHGCVYCFARPSHAYLDLSPALDFETRILTKPEAPRLLAEELRHPGYHPAPLALGSNTDPYQPVERRLKITRGLLEVISAFSHPVTIVTKSALVLRDLDIIAPMAARGLANVAISITTLDDGLARRMEPRAATPARRLETLAALSRAGIPTAVMASPMIPGLSDHELERILEAAAEAGADTAGTILLRLPHELKPIFTDWLDVHFPDRARRVLNLLRQCRAGELNEGGFGRRMTGGGVVAAMINRRFRLACKRLGLERGMPDLDCEQFNPPPRPGDQLSLF
ncbi:MAG: PA0069 family radical SAM protein [Alphaproteobacteria bacterium]|nr:PA0069 family radical SAM protein [Alphaproteobacteria bacterium]